MTTGRTIQAAASERRDVRRRGWAIWGALVLAPFALLQPRPAPAADLGGSYAPWGFNLPGRDVAVTPGDDFFGYADGAAVQHIAIPADRTA